MRVLVQASSRSWTGGPDLTMSVMDGRPVVYWTVKRILDAGLGEQVTVCAPEFDRMGFLEEVARLFPRDCVSVLYCHDASPLDRLVEATRHEDAESWIVRVDGLSFCCDTALSQQMLDLARSRNLDCVSPPDDFPPYCSSDVFRVGALRRLAAELAGPEHDVFRIYPRYYMDRREHGYRAIKCDRLPQYAPELARSWRARFEAIRIPRHVVREGGASAADLLSHHYELARTYVDASSDVLDVACGDGYGSRILAQRARRVEGLDSDAEIVALGRQLSESYENVRLRVGNATALPFDDNSFDLVATMETIDYVDDRPFLGEVQRVLRPGGVMVLSTQQNREGYMSINSVSEYGYSLRGIANLCSEYLRVERVLGIKAGRLMFDDDPVGRNTVLFCRRR
jgi:SAM-dependent methyltransferase